jgi:hypothetical protein
MSNQNLRDTIHPLSKKFAKDVPIAERNSIDLGLSLLFRTEYQSLRDAIFSDEMDKIQFGKTLFQAILITDIATPENLQLSIRRHEACREALDPLTNDLNPCINYLSDIVDGLGLAQDVIERRPADFALTQDGLQHCVRNEHLMLLSDVAHLLQGWANFVKWNFRLCEYELWLSNHLSYSFRSYKFCHKSQTRNSTIASGEGCAWIRD